MILASAFLAILVEEPQKTVFYQEYEKRVNELQPLKQSLTMTIYTYSQARQQLAEVLEKALQEGEVVIRRRDGSSFSLKPNANLDNSPLDVKGVKLNVTTDDILSWIHEGRSRTL